MMTKTASPTGFARILGERHGHVTMFGCYGRAATGVAVQADPRSEGFHLVLVSGTRALMALGPYAEGDVVAEWRLLGARTGLPLMMRLANGSTLALVAQIGNVSVGTAEPGYRKAALAGRRPRFLACRRTGRLQTVAPETNAADPLEGQGR
ncbi:MAG: hypothetical protein K0S56_4389 [Microvirga sp.]|nr:hypothetical protein [Microvirga sp.]